MKIPQVESISGKFACFLLQIEKLQAAEVILQIVGRIFHDQLIDLLLDHRVCDSKL